MATKGSDEYFRALHSVILSEIKEKGVSMVVLSSDPSETLVPEIGEFGLENIFDEVITGTHDKGEVIHELIENNKFKKAPVGVAFKSLDYLTKKYGVP